MNPRVSVIVATRNRPNDLRRLMPTVLALEGVSFEVIVVTQGESACVQDILGADPRVRSYHQLGKGKSRALNFAIRNARAPVLAFTDDDCTVPADWLRRAVPLIHPADGADLLFGNFLAVAHDPATEFVPSIQFSRPRQLRGFQWRSCGLIGMGGNMFAKRDLFEKVGGFDEDLGPGGRLRTGEECELAYRALHSGLAVQQAPEVEAIHWGIRPRRDNVARDLIVDAFYAMGAGHGKHARERELSGVAVALDDTVRNLTRVFCSLLRAHPTHGRSSAEYAKGFLAGFRAGPNWPQLPTDSGPSHC